MKKEHEYIAKLRSLIGAKENISKWYTISQEETDVFSKLTDDKALMHNDPVWAAKSPWGGTIVQAYHVLSLLPGITRNNVKRDPSLLNNDSNYTLNYGLNRVRVINPLHVGHPFRVRQETISIEEKGNGRYVVTTKHTVEIKAEEKPFLVAESLSYLGFDQELISE